MEKVGLNISPKEFKQLSKRAGNIYNAAVVIDYCLVAPNRRNFHFAFSGFWPQAKSVSLPAHYPVVAVQKSAFQLASIKPANATTLNLTI